MKILVIQTSFLGDTILSTPVLAGIKKIYPDCKLWLMTTPASAKLVRRDPILEGVIIFDKRGADRGISGLTRKVRELRSMSFDRVYALHRSWRTAILAWLSAIPVRIGFSESALPFVYQHRYSRAGYEHDVERNLAILTGSQPLSFFNSDLRLFAPPQSELTPEIKDHLTGQKPYVLVPGSAWKTKMWARRHYAELARQLKERGHKVLILGTAKEVPVCKFVAQESGTVNLAGKTDLSSLMTVIQNSALIVCNDSMALHLASAFKVPAVAVFCATVPEFGFGPWHNRAEVLGVADLPCRPCARHGANRCPTGTKRCMDGVSPQMVLRSIDAVLQ